MYAVLADRDFHLEFSPFVGYCRMSPHIPLRFDMYSGNTRSQIFFYNGSMNNAAAVRGPN